MNIFKNKKEIDNICQELRLGFLKYGYKLYIYTEYCEDFSRPYKLILVDENSHSMTYFLSENDIDILSKRHFKVILRSLVFKYHHSLKGTKHLANRMLLDRNYMKKIRRIEKILTQEGLKFSFITYSSYLFEGDLSAEMYFYIGNEHKILKFYAFEYEQFDKERIIEIYYNAFNFKQFCSLKEFTENKEPYMEQAHMIYY